MADFLETYGDKTDRQTKTTRWAFTAYEEQWPTIHEARKNPGFKTIGFQTERCPKTDRLHYQGYILLSKEQRFSWLHSMLDKVHIQKARNWKALQLYCQKEDTREPGTEPVIYVNNMYNQYTYAEILGERLYKLYKHDFEEWSDQTAHQYIEQHARLDIRAGHREIMWIISNPNWKVAWKFWRDIIASHSIDASQSHQTSSSQDGQEGPRS